MENVKGLEHATQPEDAKENAGRPEDTTWPEDGIKTRRELAKDRKLAQEEREMYAGMTAGPYYLSFSPEMAVRIRVNNGGVVPCSIFAGLAIFHLRGTGEPFIPLFRHKVQSPFTNTELKKLKQNPTLVDDRWGFTGDRETDTASSVCDDSGAGSLNPKTSPFKSRARPDRDNSNAKQSLELAADEATKDVVTFEIHFCPQFLLGMILQGEASSAGPEYSFAPGHLQIYKDFKLHDIPGKQRIVEKQGPLGQHGSRSRAKDTFSKGHACGAAEKRPAGQGCGDTLPGPQ